MSFFFIDKVQAGVFGLVCFLHRILTCTQCVDSAWEAQRMSRLFSLFFEKPPMTCDRDHPPSPPLRRDKSIPATAAAVACIRASCRVSSRVKTAQTFQIRPARVEDVPVILQLIRDLATYERAPHEVTATEGQLIDVLFGERPAAEVLLAFEEQSAVGFAVFFHNFSTWLGRPGLYLEDLFVKQDKRGKGYGRALLVELAKIARDRGCGRMV